MNSDTSLTRAAITAHLPSIMATAAGLPVKRSPGDNLSDFRHDSLESLAKLAGFSNPRANRDWAALMAAGLTKVVQSNFWPIYAARLEKCTGLIPVENLEMATIATIPTPDLHEVLEDQEPIFSLLSATTTTGRVKSYEAIMKVSTQTWATLGGELVKAVAGLAGNVYALHLKLIAECLQLIQFTADNSSGNALAIEPGLDAGLAALERKFCTPATIIIAPGQTATASTAIRLSGLQLNLVVNPFLTAGSWYLIPNPAEKTVIGKLVLITDAFFGGLNPTIKWTKIDNQRIGYYCAVDVGYSAVNTDCCYRGGVFP